MAVPGSLGFCDAGSAARQAEILAYGGPGSRRFCGAGSAACQAEILEYKATRLARVLRRLQRRASGRDSGVWRPGFARVLRRFQRRTSGRDSGVWRPGFARVLRHLQRRVSGRDSSVWRPGFARVLRRLPAPRIRPILAYREPPRSGCAALAAPRVRPRPRRIDRLGSRGLCGAGSAARQAEILEYDGPGSRRFCGACRRRASGRFWRIASRLARVVPHLQRRVNLALRVQSRA